MSATEDLWAEGRRIFALASRHEDEADEDEDERGSHQEIIFFAVEHGYVDTVLDSGRGEGGLDQMDLPFLHMYIAACSSPGGYEAHQHTHQRYADDHAEEGDLRAESKQ